MVNSAADCTLTQGWIHLDRLQQINSSASRSRNNIVEKLRVWFVTMTIHVNTKCTHYMVMVVSPCQCLTLILETYIEIRLSLVT